MGKLERAVNELQSKCLPSCLVIVAMWIVGSAGVAFLQWFGRMPRACSVTLRHGWRSAARSFEPSRMV